MPKKPHLNRLFSSDPRLLAPRKSLAMMRDLAFFFPRHPKKTRSLVGLYPAPPGTASPGFWVFSRRFWLRATTALLKCGHDIPPDPSLPWIWATALSGFVPPQPTLASFSQRRNPSSIQPNPFSPFVRAVLTFFFSSFFASRPCFDPVFQLDPFSGFRPPSTKIPQKRTIFFVFRSCFSVLILFFRAGIAEWGSVPPLFRRSPKQVH